MIAYALRVAIMAPAERKLACDRQIGTSGAIAGEVDETDPQIKAHSGADGVRSRTLRQRSSTRSGEGDAMPLGHRMHRPVMARMPVTGKKPRPVHLTET